MEKIRSDAPCFGTWLSSGSPTVTELAARCGFDWLLFDMEHGCLSEADLLANLRAAGGRDVVLVVRVPTHESGLIGRALDWGADAIMVPHVESAEEARDLVAAMCYPPRGRRGYSRSVRAFSYGLREPGAHPMPSLFVQIESVEGVANVEEIASVDGVDVLFVGPADLGLSLSHHSSAPCYEDALSKVVHAARSHGICSGILLRKHNDVGPRLKEGFTKIAVDSDLSILRSGFLSITRKE